MGQRRKLHRSLCTPALMLGGLLALGTALPAEDLAPAEVFRLAEVERGQRGYGLSVFEGRETERFDMEVVGVWKNVQPETSFILARLSGMGLDETGVIAGMSGSPVFIDDRLLGAVAFAWPFAQEAIAGITPIESMRKLIDIDPPPARPRSQGSSIDLQTLARQEVSADLLDRAIAKLRPVTLGEGAAALEWSVSGFGEASRSLLEKGIGSLASSGRVAGYAGPLEPGGSVAAVLIDGDLRLASTGTVTDRIADTVLAFGHPFLGLGSVAVPMASAEVVTVISSLANSFKVTNLGEIVGALDFDHAVGVRGQVGLEAPMVPMSVRLRGANERLVELRLASIESITPALAAIATLGALDAATEAVGSEGLDLLAGFDLGEAGRLQIDQSFEGPTAKIDAALYLFSIVGYLLQNDLAKVELMSVDIELERHVEPRTLRLVGAHAGRSVVRPGEAVTLNLDLVEFRGKSIRKSIVVDMPTNLPAGRYSLLVGDGVAVDAARLAIERVEPVNFDQALHFLDSLSSRRELVVIGVFGEAGLSVAGEVLPRLPGSMRSLWGAAPSGSARPLRLAIAQQERLRLEVPVAGILRVDLEVERKRPWSPADSGTGEAESDRGSPETAQESNG